MGNSFGQDNQHDEHDDNQHDEHDDNQHDDDSDNSDEEDKDDNGNCSDKKDKKDDIYFWISFAQNVMLVGGAILIIYELFGDKGLAQQTQQTQVEEDAQCPSPRESHHIRTMSSVFVSPNRCEEYVLHPESNSELLDVSDLCCPNVSDSFVPMMDNDTSASDDDGNVCVICAHNKIKTIFLGCGHMALCLECSRKYVQTQKDKNVIKIECIICKQPVTQIKQTFCA